MADRTGVLREADGGFLFRDEIGELGLDDQAMLVRAREEKCFAPFLPAGHEAGYGTLNRDAFPGETAIASSMEKFQRPRPWRSAGR